jgi:TRAP transporter TAXI family solute receptor
MKKLLSVFLLVALVASFGLVGCSSEETPTPEPTTAPTTAPTTTPEPEPEPEWVWPDRIDIQSSTRTGEAQWVSFAAVMSASTGMDVKVVPQGNVSLRFKAVKNGEFLATAGGNTDFANNIEALTNYASKDGGPWQIRVVWPYSVMYSGYIVKGDSDIKTIADIKAGVKIADYTKSPTMRTNQFGGLIAWAGLTEDDVEWVPISDYTAMQQAVSEGRIDISYAFMTSSVLLELSGAPGGIRLLDLPYDTDPEGAQRMLDAWNTGSFAVVETAVVPDFVGVKSFGGLTHMLCRDDADVDLVYNMAKWFNENYDAIKDTHAANEYMTLDNLVLAAETGFIPLHDGTIKYLQELGLYTDNMAANQAANVAHIQTFVDGYAAAVAAAEAQGLEILGENADWQAFWTQYKTDHGLEPFKSHLLQ